MIILKSLISLILVFVLVEIANAQMIGVVFVGREYDVENDKLDMTLFFHQPKVCFLFKTRESTFNKLKLVLRVIKIEGKEESIYSTEEYEVDPDWDSTYDYLYLKPGTYQIKFYDLDANILGKSLNFYVKDN